MTGTSTDGSPPHDRRRQFGPMQLAVERRKHSNVDHYVRQKPILSATSTPTTDRAGLTRPTKPPYRRRQLDSLPGHRQWRTGEQSATIKHMLLSQLSLTLNDVDLGSIDAESAFLRMSKFMNYLRLAICADLFRHLTT
jgi:hypothetical protein